MLVAFCAVAAGVVSVGVDLMAARIAQRRVARRIAIAWQAASTPQVRFCGGPFLVQLAARRFREIRLSVPACTAGGIAFDHLEASLTSVRAPGRGVVAAELTATAAIPFAALAERLPPGFTLRRHGDGPGAELRIHGSALAVPVSGSVEVAADLRRISVSPRIAGIPSVVGFRIELPGLPPEVAITSISLADTALTVSLAGRDVRLAAAGSVDDGVVGQIRRTRTR